MTQSFLFWITWSFTKQLVERAFRPNKMFRFSDHSCCVDWKLMLKRDSYPRRKPKSMLGSQRCKDSGKFGYVIWLTPDFLDLQRSNCIQSHLISSPTLTSGFVHVSLCFYPSVALAKQPTSLPVVLLIIVKKKLGLSWLLSFRFGRQHKCFGRKKFSR